MITLEAEQVTENLFLSLELSAIERVRNLFGTAIQALADAGSVLNEQKEILGRKYKSWLEENELASSEANKLVKLFSSFNEITSELSCNPLVLLKLLGNNSTESKQVFIDLVEKRKEKREKRKEKREEYITDFDVLAIKKAYDTRRAKKETPLVKNGNNLDFEVIIREQDLAREMTKTYEELGETPTKVFSFLNESSKAVRDISEIVLGRRIESTDEIESFKVAVINKLKSIDMVSISELDVETVKSNSVEIKPSIQSTSLSTVPGEEFVSKIGKKIIGYTAVVSERVENVSDMLKERYEEFKGKVCIITQEPTGLDSKATIEVEIKGEGKKNRIFLSWLDILVNESPYVNA